MSISPVPITRNGFSGSRTCWSTRASSPPRKSPPAMRCSRQNRSSAASSALDDVERVMVRGKFGRAAPAPAKFKPGDRVRAKNIHPATHTRLPRYVRGHVGVVERDHGCHVFPDTAAMEAGENPQWLYTVVFDGAELWGADADPTREDLHRRVRALSGAGVMDSAAAARATARRAGHSARRRRPGVSRALGSAGLCDGARAARARTVHLDRMGGSPRRPRSSARRPPAIPTPARPITGTGWRRWNIWSPQRASRHPRPCIAIATPGTTPPTARRMARRSS